MVEAQTCRKSKANSYTKIKEKDTDSNYVILFFGGIYRKTSTIFFFVREFFFFIGTKIMVLPERGTKMRAYNIAAAGNPIRESGSGSNVVL